MTASPRRILLVRLSHLGDVVHALPVFHALRAAHPEAEIAWAVQPEFAGLLDGLPGLDRAFLFERRKGARAWLRLLASLREWAPDWAVDAQGNAKSALVTIGSGAGRRTGSHPADWRERFASRVLTDHPVPAGGDPSHAMDRMLALAAFVARGHGDARTDPGLSAREIEDGRARLAERTGERERAVVLVHLSAPADVRSWPIARFAALARGLAEEGEPVLVISGPQEEGEGRALEREVGDRPLVRHWIGQRGLRELAAVLAAARERGGRMVCCDSGPMHLAASVGLPVIGLAGPQDERRTGPWPLPARSAIHAVLRAADPPACAPCRSRRCDHPGGPVCMSRIEHADVLQTVLAGGEASRRGLDSSSWCVPGFSR